jgi:hypothetical protein
LRQIDSGKNAVVSHIGDSKEEFAQLRLGAQ